MENKGLDYEGLFALLISLWAIFFVFLVGFAIASCICFEDDYHCIKKCEARNDWFISFCYIFLMYSGFVFSYWLGGEIKKWKIKV